MKMIWKIALLSIVCGLILSALGFVFGAGRENFYFDRTGLHVAGVRQERLMEIPLEGFKSIELRGEWCDAQFIPADEYRLEIYGVERDWNWEVKDEILRIEHTQKRFEFSIFNFGENGASAKIYFPRESTFDQVFIKMDSGNVNLAKFQADHVEIRNAFGNVELEEIFCRSLLANLSSGNLILQDVKTEEMNLQNSFGKITMEDSASSKTYVSADSGDIRLSGDLAGETTVRCSFGNVKIFTEQAKEMYAYNLETSFGNVSVDGQKAGTVIIEGISGGEADSSAVENRLKAFASSGNIEVYFGYNFVK